MTTASAGNAACAVGQKCVQEHERIRSQWIGSSGMGQSIRLAADGHQASNWLELDMVRSNPSIADSRNLLGQNVAQAIALSRGIGFHY